MNNLKRILSLALASVMLVGMMVVGASATSYPDDDAIVNKEAVDTLQALGIMKGDDKGNFNPGNNLKRCEAVKILATIHNKGREVNFGSTVDAPFPDVAANHWALEVISYAKSFGIANGYDDGTFKPENPLTVVQLVRMTLNMMGYTEGQSGRDWEIQTTVLANDLGLFDGLESYIPSANVTRDQAAQIICNSLSAPMANATTTQRTYYTLANKPDQTDVPAALLAMEFETATDAAAVAESYGLSNKYLINKSTKTTTQSLSGKYLDMTEGHGVVRSLSVITSGDNKGKYTMTTTTGTYTVASDYSKYIGEDVKILYKGDNKNAVYGVFPISSVVYDGTVGEYQLLVNADSTNGATINGLTIFTQTGATLAEKLPTANKAFKLKAVDTTGDKVADTLTVEVSTYGAVSFVGSTTINISGTGTLTLKNIDLYEGAKVGDWAIVTNTANGTVVTKAEAVTGTIESTNNAGGVRVAGTWYPAATTDTVAKTAIGKDYDLVLVNGYYVYADTAKADAAASNDLLYVIKSVNGASQGTLDAGAPLARVINAEGKVQDITLSSEHTTAVAAEKFYTYKVESNGTYTLKEVNATNKAGYETVTIGNLSWYVTTVNNKTTGTLSNAGSNAQNLADDAKVIVFHNTSKKGNGGTALNTMTGCESKVTDVTTLGTIEILTGKDVKNWGKGFGDAAKTVAFAKSSNGISYVQLLFIAADAKNLPNAAATDNTGFGFVVSDETTFEVVNNQTVSVYTIWDGAKNVTVKDAKQTVVEAGDLVSYEENTDGTINGKLLVEDTDFAVGAVSGWNTADKLVKITKMDGADSGVKSINDYTAILYVDTAKGVGVEGGAAEPMATKLDNGAYVPNVYFAKDADDVLTLLVVDTSNKIAGTEFPNTMLDADAIKDLKPGHYTGTYLGQVDDRISAEPEKYLMFFVYTSPKDAVEYTLTVKNEKDETVSTQKYTPSDREDGKTHYFVMDLRNGGYNGTNSDGSAAGNTANMLEGNHTYTWTITYTDGAETKTAGRNSFTYNTPKAS